MVRVSGQAFRVHSPCRRFFKLAELYVQTINQSIYLFKHPHLSAFQMPKSYSSAVRTRICVRATCEHDDVIESNIIEYNPILQTAHNSPRPRRSCLSLSFFPCRGEMRVS
jgi:hypothetical protein